MAVSLAWASGAGLRAEAITSKTAADRARVSRSGAAGVPEQTRQPLVENKT